MPGGYQTPLLGGQGWMPVNVGAGGVTVVDTSNYFTGTDLETVLAEIGAALLGNFLTVINGGGGTVQAHGNLGATETINLANGNYHWGTLNANCTFTFTVTADTKERWFTLELIEDGTGGWTVTWPGSVTWLGGSTPAHTTTAGTTTIYAFFTRNGGTTWIGGQLGAGVSFATPAIVLGAAAAAGAAGTVIRSDSTIAAFDTTVPEALGTAATGSIAKAARRDHVHPLPSTVQVGGHVHAVNEPAVGDGATTVFYLANEAELDTVAAYVNGVRTDVTQDPTLLDKVTFGAAPASSAALRFDYVPALS